MNGPEYIKKIEDSPLFQYEKTMAMNRCMADYAHMDSSSKDKWCLDKLGYYIVTQPHKTRAMRLEEGTGGSLNIENYSPIDSLDKKLNLNKCLVVFLLIAMMFFVLYLIK